MAGLCWMAVTLGLLLSVGNSSADFERPSNSQFKIIVDELWTWYRPSYTDSTGQSRYPMHSVAVRIPYNNNKKQYDVSLVIDSADDSPAKVKKSILSCAVYKSTTMVAATVLKWPDVLEQCPNEEVQWSIVRKNCEKKAKMTWAQLETACPEVECTADHVEYRVLQNFDTLNNQNKNDFLLFYVLASPCVDKCTDQAHRFNILTSITQIKKWKNYAFVFSDVFQPRDAEEPVVPEEELIGALERLGSKIGLENIYRCTAARCSRCTVKNEEGLVNPFCYTDKAQAGPSHNLPSASASASKQSGQGKTAPKNNNINKNAGVSTNVGGSSGGVVGQGDSGGEGGRWMVAGKKGKKTTEGEGVSSS